MIDLLAFGYLLKWLWGYTLVGFVFAIAVKSGMPQGRPILALLACFAAMLLWPLVFIAMLAGVVFDL